jgi:signal transduction histidine kinase
MAPESGRRTSRYSLAARLLAISTILGVVVLVITAFLLTTLYRNNVERSFAERLDLSIFNLVATAQFDAEGTLMSVPLLAGEWYDQFGSGWYWQVSRTEDGAILARSGSLGTEVISAPDLTDAPFDPTFRRSFQIADFSGQLILALEQRITSAESGQILSYIIAGPVSEVEADIARFRGVLSTTLAIFALAFLGLIALATALAFRPLKRVGRTIEQIARGEQRSLDENYPTEIAPLVAQINGLIAANARTVERARTHVGNLAHALKTPLSVLRNESTNPSPDFAKLVQTQTVQMQSQVDYHLKRARAAAQAHTLTVITPVEPVIAAMARTMGKIHQDRNLEITANCPSDLAFRGERQDFEEMLGNLFDNACKWAKSNVQVSCLASVQDGPAGPNPLMLEVVVEDDGPGLSESEIEAALQRGTRLDEAVPGTGLGLAIVRDLVTLYDGELALSQSQLGGLEVKLRLPAAQLGSRGG